MASNYNKTRKVVKKKKSLCEMSMELVLNIIKLSSISLSGGSSSKAVRRTGKSDRDHVGVGVTVRSGTAKVTANSNSSSSFVDRSRPQKIRPDIIGSRKSYSLAAKGRGQYSGSSNYAPVVGNNNGIKNSHNVDKRATDFITRIRRKHQNDLKLH